MTRPPPTLPRRFVEAALEVWELDDLVEVVALLTSELVTNAVLHARTAFTVRATFARPELRVEVSDGRVSTSTRRPTTRTPKAESGPDAGGHVVEITGRPSGGKTVWFVLPAA